MDWTALDAGGLILWKSKKKKMDYIGSLDLRLGFYGVYRVENTIAILEYTNV